MLTVKAMLCTMSISIVATAITTGGMPDMSALAGMMGGGGGGIYMHVK
jgi:hypothetical protein